MFLGVIIVYQAMSVELLPSALSQCHIGNLGVSCVYFGDHITTEYNMYYATYCIFFSRCRDSSRTTQAPKTALKSTTGCRGGTISLSLVFKKSFSSRRYLRLFLRKKEEKRKRLVFILDLEEAPLDTHLPTKKNIHKKGSRPISFHHQCFVSP